MITTAQDYKWYRTRPVINVAMTFVVDLAAKDTYHHTNKLLNDEHTYIRTQHIALVNRAWQQGYDVCIADNGAVYNIYELSPGLLSRSTNIFELIMSNYFNQHLSFNF